MVSNWKKAVFAWSFGMIWGFVQAVVQFIYRNFYFDRFYFAKGKYLEYSTPDTYEQPEVKLTKEQQDSLDEQWPSDEEPSDEEWVSAQRYYEEAEKCDKIYRKAEAEYLDVMRNTAPDDPIREKYKPKPYPSNKEITESYYKHSGMFTN